MAANLTAMSHAKQLKVRDKYVNECIEDGIVNIFFKSAENVTSILKRNFGRDLYEKQSKKLLVRSQHDFLGLEIFKGEKKGIRDDVLSSGIQFEITLMNWGSIQNWQVKPSS